MKKWIVMLFALLPSLAMAAGANVPLDKANNDLSDQASLQNGAKLFMNYCFGCHSAQYQRYERVATDLGIPIELMKEHLIFDPEVKVGSLMENSIPDKQAGNWFGAPPPDLTLVARVRGADWLYTYLRSFYADPSRPFGVNNVVFPSVGMPHVLEELQGIPTAIYETKVVDGEEKQVVVGIETDGRGELSPTEYDSAVRDLVNFLEYSGDPVKLERHTMGWWVMAFLVLLTIVVVFLKKEYWRDVH
ncbi:ubiquinol--cytochrome c reductase, cytochrome c1 [Vibrio nigripulchritudo ATCC 27043]|uniref:Cytochrome c1 n=2 Tax=Vibrio nigripulchritudo TaxID=28173 RepID=A0AAV2VR93_9VIBR|nr:MULTISPECIES: cytochrome c1 [Vibrio]EGU61808.1 ubiquinol--cytochrome c reductase, cytochrome c1 [Vibrio nigripulchritudo ATCC 27043]KJY71702.1 cytochrome C [Vibrio nigripulchritudo]UAB70820.1 cytochrome c1 [Vibrio sp. SCSIO 43132]CCN35566.1 putative Cytochrome c1 [Vibrio nigripulchritudo AM115]CCN40848.1 putative Cytochrome c1 [Vibrio nigripulchritudo FTn2]